jgi:regulatory protein
VEAVPKAYPLALRWLTVRARSVAALRKKLHDRGCEAKDIEAALQRCQELGYLDDHRYAVEVAGQLLRRGAAVGSSLVYELKKRGIAEHLATAAIEQCREECAEYAEDKLLAALVQRRYANIDLVHLEQKQKSRIVNYLQRRGFALAMILNHLKEVKDLHVKR